MRNIKTRHAARTILLALLGTSALAVAAQARGLDTLYRFGGSDGNAPLGALIQGGDGMFYGTTSRGGPADRGTVFKLAPDGTQTLLYDFADPSVGGFPQAGLYRDAQGNLFGTSFGDNKNGSVFEVPADGSGAKALYDFSAGNRAGYGPESQLAADARGNLYGTTRYGGANDGGTLFKLTPGGKLSVLHAFGAIGDGGAPVAGVTLDDAGNIYGTTNAGGANNAGTVYRLAKDGTYAHLHDFDARVEGFEPWGGLTRDAQGNLYGTTMVGGDAVSGTLFKIAPDGAFTTLHSFGKLQGEGDTPLAAPTLDAHGNLIATTSTGGMVNCGGVVEVHKDGTAKVLNTFTLVGRRVRGGCQPAANPIIGTDGALYGTTSEGGSRSHPLGTVYRLEH